MKRNYPQNPASPEAMILAEVKSGVGFAVINEDGEEVKAGTFLEGPDYDESEGCYLPVRASIQPDGKQQIVGMYETGIVCAPNGEWPGSFTVRKAFQQ
jgi:hypothetical protein